MKKPNRPKSPIKTTLDPKDLVHVQGGQAPKEECKK